MGRFIPVSKDDGPHITATSHVTTKPGYSNETSNSYTGSMRIMRGERIPGYHSRRKAGEFLPYTSWLQSEIKTLYTPGGFRADKINDPYFEQGAGIHNSFVGTLPTEAPLPDTSSADYYLQSAAADLYNRGWDALTFSAELGKTVRSFRGISKRIVSLATRFNAKRAHDFWLEGRYSFRTLAYDVRDLHDALVNFDDKRSIHSERSGRTYSVFAEGGSTINTTEALHTLGWNSETTHSVRGSIAAVIDPDRIVTNPVQTAWELVPWSFILDWVYDVGTSLAAISFLNSATKHTSAIGHYTEMQVTGSMTQTANSGYVVSGGGYHGQSVTKVTQRSPRSITVIPQLTNRRLTGELALDLQALSRIRR